MKKLRFIDGINTNVSRIDRHPKHPIHDDLRLAQSVLNGDAKAIEQFSRRLLPYIDDHASDPIWETVEAGRAHGVAVLHGNNYDWLQRWRPRTRSLSQHIQHLLQKELTSEIVRRRNAIKENPQVAEAIESCRDELSDTHYWILKKLVVDGTALKQLPKYFNECPEIRLLSPNSIGTTYRRALQRLESVCADKHKPLVLEFRRTRKRSGR